MKDEKCFGTVCNFCENLNMIKDIHKIVDKFNECKWIDQVAIETTCITDTSEGYSLDHGRYPINFCPVCGKKLKGDEK